MNFKYMTKDELELAITKLQNSLAVLKFFKLNTTATMKNISEYKSQLENIEQLNRKSQKITNSK
jgi:hypothetical protein